MCGCSSAGSPARSGVLSGREKGERRNVYTRTVHPHDRVGTHTPTSAGSRVAHCKAYIRGRHTTPPILLPNRQWTIAPPRIANRDGTIVQKTCSKRKIRVKTNAQLVPSCAPRCRRLPTRVGAVPFFESMCVYILLIYLCRSTPPTAMHLYWRFGVQQTAESRLGGLQKCV